MMKILNTMVQDNMQVISSMIVEKTKQKLTVHKIRKEKEKVKNHLVVNKDMLLKLHHPNLPKFLGVVDQPETYMIIMEYIEGISLSEAIKESRTIETIVDWIKQLSDVLTYLQTQQPAIYCRTLHTDQMILTPDGKIVLIDFYISREYKDPNVKDASIYPIYENYAEHKQIDERTNVYCLGSIFYYLLTGTYIHNFPNALQHKLPSELENIIIKCTRSHPDDRYQSIKDFLSALNDYMKASNEKLTICNHVFKKNHNKDVSQINSNSYSQLDPFSYHQTQSDDMKISNKKPNLFQRLFKKNNNRDEVSQINSNSYSYHQSQNIPSTSIMEPISSFQNDHINISQVSFSAIVPKRLIKGEYATIEISIYEEMYRHIVDRMIANADIEVREVMGGVQDIMQSTMVRILLSSRDIELEDCDERQKWSGKYLIFDFPIEVPNNYDRKQIRFNASVYFNDIIATKLKFVVSCTSLREQKLELIREDVLTAFISYASQDRAEVATIIQGMKKIRPDLDIFFDVDNLRSGEYWENALKAEIEKRDILYLCWSKYAKESEWVEKEWKYALYNKGLDAIEPVSLISPSICPPPDELKSKHFNDKALMYKNV